MKKMVLILAIIFPLSIFGQIKIVNSFEKEQAEKEALANKERDSIYREKLRVSYDSLSPYPEKDAVYGLVGQRMVVKPYDNRRDRYKFFTSPSIFNLYEPSSSSPYTSEYDFDFKYTSTKSSSVKNRIFTVTKIIPEEEGKRHVYIELQDSLGTLYYRHNLFGVDGFPFNIEGYIAKQTELGKKVTYVSKDDYRNYVADVFFDFYTGKPIKIIIGEEWVLKEIVIDPEDGKLRKLFSNAKGEVYDVTHCEYNFLDKKESDRIKKKYGLSQWKLILNHEICNGMSKSAVEESWGEPEYINRTSYNEQWVYRDSYVYFKNGRVVGWN